MLPNDSVFFPMTAALCFRSCPMHLACVGIVGVIAITLHNALCSLLHWSGPHFGGQESTGYAVLEVSKPELPHTI